MYNSTYRHLRHAVIFQKSLEVILIMLEIFKLIKKVLISLSYRWSQKRGRYGVKMLNTKYRNEVVHCVSSVPIHHLFKIFLKSENLPEILPYIHYQFHLKLNRDLVKCSRSIIWLMWLNMFYKMFSERLF